MEALFLKILNLSISAIWVVLAVVLLRFAMPKAPKALRVVLWGIVGLRLVWPFSIESILSLIPSAETVPPDIGMAPVPAIHSGIHAINSSVNPMLAETMAATPQYSINPMQVAQFIATWVWVIGMAVMALYALISWLVIRIRVREAMRERENIWLCDRVGSPFILGLFAPRIYLPSDMAAEDLPYVLAHEQAHIKRKDHLWKPLGFLLLTVHWFNPVLWLAYILLCRDIELACDEKVVKALGEEGKKPYSEALIHCSAPRRMITACPVAFGETGVKARIKSVLHYKKPAFWIILVAVVACVAVAVCFLTDPKTEEPDPTKPPVLTVASAEGEEIVAWQGGYEWRYEENGQMVMVNTDANHPTAEADKLPSITLTPSKDSQAKWDMAYLKFDTEPDSITVTRWAEGEEKFVYTIGTTALEAMDGKHLYVVTANWNEQGSCTYGFFVEAKPEDRESLEVNIPELWVSDGRGQSIRAALGNWKWNETVDGKLLRDEKTGVKLSDLESQLPVMEIKPGLDSFIYDETVLLQFSVQPHKMTLYVHDFGEEEAVAHSERNASNRDDMSCLGLSSGRKIYAIHAVWFNHGEAYFYFVGDREIPEYADPGQPLTALQRSHPQYFGLDPKAGMKVYVWQEGFGDYRCILLPDSAGQPTDAQLRKLRGEALNMQSMRSVLYAYGANMAEVPVVPIRMPGSPYEYEITDELQNSLRVRLWDPTPSSWVKDPHWKMDITCSDLIDGKITVTIRNHGVNQHGEMTLESVNLWSEEKQESLEPIAELKGDLDWFVNMELPLPVGETVTFVLDLPEIYGEIPGGEYLLSFSIWDHLGADSASYYPYDRMNYWGYGVPLTIE